MRRCWQGWPQAVLQSCCSGPWQPVGRQGRYSSAQLHPGEEFSIQLSKKTGVTLALMGAEDEEGEEWSTESSLFSRRSSWDALFCCDLCFTEQSRCLHPCFTIERTQGACNESDILFSFLALILVETWATTGSMKFYGIINICMIAGIIALGVTQRSATSTQEPLTTEAR